MEEKGLVPDEDGKVYVISEEEQEKKLHRKKEDMIRKMTSKLTDEMHKSEKEVVFSPSDARAPV